MPINLGFRTYINAASRFINDEDFGTNAYPHGKKHFLLVPTGKLADRLVDTRGNDVKPFPGFNRGSSDLGIPDETQTISKLSQTGRGVVFTHRHGKIKAEFFAVLGHV